MIWYKNRSFDGILNPLKLEEARKTPNGIMDGFFKKVNLKVNIGRLSTPDARPSGHRYFWGQI